MDGPRLECTTPASQCQANTWHSPANAVAGKEFQVQNQTQSRMLSGLVVALVIGLAATSTFAHEGKPSSGGAMAGNDMMQKIDSDGDGSISAAEHAAYAQRMFSTMDANQDGMVSKAELDAGMKAMRGDHMKAGAAKAGADGMANDRPTDDMMPASPPAPPAPPQN